MTHLTTRDISVISAVVTYYVLNRQQIQSLCFPHDKGGRATRKRVQGLVSGGFISRHSLFLLNSAPCPVYYPTRKGAEFLAAYFDDERFLAANTQCPQAHLLYHWIEINNTRLLLEAAIKQQSDIRLDAWHNEFDVVNKEERSPEKRFKIFQLIRESPRLVAAPDAAFLLSRAETRKAVFLEQDRNTTPAQQIAASKTPGYAAMQEANLHRRIFPDAAQWFLVLMVTPDSVRREAVRRAIRGKPGADRWRFVSAMDLRPETFLSAAIMYRCEDDAPLPLVKGGANA